MNMPKIFTKDLVEEYREFFSSDPELIVSAPGRIDFLNTHQDYKGLPVVGAAINLRTYVVLGRSRSDKNVIISRNMRDLGERYVDTFSPDRPEILREKFFGNYIRASVISLRLKNFEIQPFYAYISSDVSIGSGLGSSGTLLVSLIYGLNQLFKLGLDIYQIAELAYIAEHDVLGIPCGRLDQYTSAFGGVVKIETRPPYRVENLDFNEGVFIVLDTGIRHSTGDIHPKRQREIDYALELLKNVLPEDLKRGLGAHYYDTMWEDIDLEKIEHYLINMPYPYGNRILFTLKMQRSTEDALRILRGEKIDLENMSYLVDELRIFLNKKIFLTEDRLRLLGVIMTYQHSLLSRLYDVSLPTIDLVVKKIIDLGGLGAKISGAGMGGSIIALADDHKKAQKILRRVLDEKLVSRGWIVRIDEGVRVDERF
jgi:galactokinase